MHRHAGGMCQVSGSKCVYRERKRGLKYNRISCFWVFHALPYRSDSGDTLSPCSMMKLICRAFGRPKCARGFCENRFQTHGNVFCLLKKIQTSKWTALTWAGWGCTRSTGDFGTVGGTMGKAPFRHNGFTQSSPMNSYA
jgi:hypothetical protein